MSVKSLSLLLVISLSLSGCSLFKCKETIDVNTVPIAKPKLQIENSLPLKPRKVTWLVVTPENASVVFTNLDKKNDDLALFSLTDEEYENLSMNIAELRKYIVQQNKIISAYRKYYEEK